MDALVPALHCLHSILSSATRGPGRRYFGVKVMFSMAR
jgi:hypothetical protein